MPFNRIYYGWVVVIAGAFVLSACSFALFTFGVFIGPLNLEFGWERGPLSLATSITFGISGLAGLVTGKICDRYGPKIIVTLGGIIMGAGFLLMAHVNTLVQVYIFWGLLLGIAHSCCTLPILSTIPRWFVRKRGIAVSMTFAGFGLGSIITPLLAQVLISSFGWRNAVIIIGIIAWTITIPMSQLTRKDPAEMKLRPYGESEELEGNDTGKWTRGLSLTEATQTFPFWILSTISFLWLFCQQIVIVHVVPHATDKGIAELVAAGILSIIAGFTVAGKLSIGLISDKLGARKSLSLCLILGTLTFVWFFFAKETWAFYLFAIAFGFALGGTKPLDMLVPSELFGVQSLGAILGVILLCGTMGGALGPAFAGYTFDIAGNYNAALISLVVLSMIAAVLSLVLLKYKSKAIQDL
jgi:OFA family oxalate/formate antiporter-like MFS transporter